MAIHRSATQQWATAAVNHNTFISVINIIEEKKKKVCVCVCRCLGVNIWVPGSSFTPSLLTSLLSFPVSLTDFAGGDFVVRLR